MASTWQMYPLSTSGRTPYVFDPAADLPHSAAATTAAAVTQQVCARGRRAHQPGDAYALTRDPFLLLLLFCRYVHEADVPTNLETQEALLDWALDRMGLAEGERLQ